MDGGYAFEKTRLAAEGFVDELVDEDDVFGVYFFAKAADSGAGDYSMHADAFECEDIGGIWNIGGTELMARAVTIDEGDVVLTYLTQKDIAAGFAERSIDTFSPGGREFFLECVAEAAASDDSDDGFVHKNSFW